MNNGSLLEKDQSECLKSIGPETKPCRKTRKELNQFQAEEQLQNPLNGKGFRSQTIKHFTRCSKRNKSTDLKRNMKSHTGCANRSPVGRLPHPQAAEADAGPYAEDHASAGLLMIFDCGWVMDYIWFVSFMMRLWFVPGLWEHFMKSDLQSWRCLTMPTSQAMFEVSCAPAVLPAHEAKWNDQSLVDHCFRHAKKYHLMTTLWKILQNRTEHFYFDTNIMKKTRWQRI